MPRRMALMMTVGWFVLLILTVPAGAAPMMFLKDTAISKMTKSDMELLRSSLNSALESTADGESLFWENSETGAKGVLTPQETYELDGATCRKLLIVNSAGGLSGKSVYDFCRQSDGDWKVPAPVSAGADKQK